MNINSLTENAEKKQNYLKNKSVFIGIFVVVISCIFVFMFASPYIFKRSADQMYFTETGKEIEIGSGHTVMIESWQYSKDNKEMEVVLSFNNTSYDGIDTYKYSALSRDDSNKTQQLKTETLYESSFFSVIKISQLKNFTEVRLSVSYDTSPLLSRDKEQQTNSAALFTNINKVEMVDEFAERDIITLYSEKLDNQIREINLNISDLQSDINEYKEIQNNILEKVAEIRENQQYMTDTETAASEQQIQNYENSYNEYSSNIEDLESQIDEYSSQIAERKNKQEQLENLRKK